MLYSGSKSLEETCLSIIKKHSTEGSDYLDDLKYLLSLMYGTGLENSDTGLLLRGIDSEIDDIPNYCSSEEEKTKQRNKILSEERKKFLEAVEKFIALSALMKSVM
jgi:hypothetical protein